MKRTVGITILCLALLWLTISGAGNAYFILNGQMHGIPMHIGWLSMMYAITAFLSSIGLWFKQSWGLLSLRIWMLVCLIILAAMAQAFKHIYLVGTPGIIGFSVVIICVFWILNRYVSSHLQANRKQSALNE